MCDFLQQKVHSSQQSYGDGDMLEYLVTQIQMFKLVLPRSSWHGNAESPLEYDCLGDVPR